jgi:hypothetical protein
MLTPPSPSAVSYDTVRAKCEPSPYYAPHIAGDTPPSLLDLWLANSSDIPLHDLDSEHASVVAQCGHHSVSRVPVYVLQRVYELRVLEECPQEPELRRTGTCRS